MDNLTINKKYTIPYTAFTGVKDSKGGGEGN